MDTHVENKFDKKIYMDKYNKPYYEKNKEETLKKAGEKMKCEICNRMVRNDYLIKHQLTKICQENMSTKYVSAKVQKERKKIINLEKRINDLNEKIKSLSTN